MLQNGSRLLRVHGLPFKLAVGSKSAEAVRHFKVTETETKLKFILGFRSVFRRFVPNFACVTAPEKALLVNSKPSRLESLSDNKWRYITIWSQLSYHRQDCLYLDLTFHLASIQMHLQSIGFALLQSHEDNKRQPTCYGSQMLNQAQLNYRFNWEGMLGTRMGMQDPETFLGWTVLSGLYRQSASEVALQRYPGASLAGSSVC